MEPEIALSEYRVEVGILECVAARGAHNLGFKDIAQLFGCTLTPLYRRFRGWHELMAFVHESLLDAIDSLFDCPASSRREEFELWWGRLISFFRSRHGEAFLALRPCASNGRDMASLARAEVERLVTFTRWVTQSPTPPGQSPEVVARWLWSLLLFAAGEPAAENDARENAWSLVATTH